MAIDTSKIDLKDVKTLSEIGSKTDNSEFKYSLELQGRTIRFRTWKVS